MSLPSSPSSRRSLLLRLGVLALGCAAAAFFLLRGVDLRWWIERGLEFVRGLGPVAFFAAMAVLPAFGCPLSAFTLTAGPVFSKELGMPCVVALALASIAVNLAFSYWLSRYALRPWIVRLLRWLGHAPPEVAAEDRLGLLVLVRVTPGPPYALQNFVLGVTAIPFRPYLAVSWAIVGVYSAAFILFGDVLVHGRGKMAFLAVSLFAAFTVGVRFLRRHYQRRRASSS